MCHLTTQIYKCSHEGMLLYCNLSRVTPLPCLWRHSIFSPLKAEPEWLRQLECTLYGTLNLRFESHQCGQVHGSKRLSYNAGNYEVSRCYTRGESEESITHKWGSTQQVIHHGLETQGRHPQKFKSGVSVAPQKGLMSSNNFKTEMIFSWKCTFCITHRSQKAFEKLEFFFVQSSYIKWFWPWLKLLRVW